MRNLLLYLCLVIFTGSCRTILMGNPAENNPKPSVTLKNGKKIEAAEVRKTAENIVADNVKYPKKDVATYSDGDNTYARVRKKGTYAPLKFIGDINVYNISGTYTSVSSRGVSSTHSYSMNFIQKNGTGTVKPLMYKNLKPLVLKGDPGYPALRGAFYNRIKGHTALYGGLAGFWTGIIMYTNNVDVTGTWENKTGKTAGIAILCAGMTSFISTPYFRWRAKYLLQKSVAKHNRVL